MTEDFHYSLKHTRIDSVSIEIHFKLNYHRMVFIFNSIVLQYFVFILKRGLRLRIIWLIDKSLTEKIIYQYRNTLLKVSLI